MKTVKYSRQREAIKNYLMNRKDHPTAEMIYEAIRESCPKISLGTVYRNLTFLVDHGEILRLFCGEERDRFDANIEDHCHVVCKQCGCVDDLDMVNLDHINDVARQHYNGRIYGHQTYFYGLCPTCCQAAEQRA